MATNTIVLIVVAATAMLVLAGMIAGVAYKTRDEYAARAQAARVEIETKTIRARALQQQESAHRSAAARTREMDFSVGNGAHVPATPFAAPRSDHPTG
jgi:hypothetical protein